MKFYTIEREEKDKCICTSSLMPSRAWELVNGESCLMFLRSSNDFYLLLKSSFHGLRYVKVYCESDHWYLDVISEAVR